MRIMLWQLSYFLPISVWTTDTSITLMSKMSLWKSVDAAMLFMFTSFPHFLTSGRSIQILREFFYLFHSINWLQHRTNNLMKLIENEFIFVDRICGGAIKEHEINSADMILFVFQSDPSQGRDGFTVDFSVS